MILSSRRFKPLSFAAIVIVASLLLPLATTTLSQDDSATRIRFAFWGDAAELRAYEQIAESFQKQNPQIFIEIDYTPGQSDYYRKLATDFAAGNAPNVFLTNYRTFGQYAASGALHPVEELVSESGSLELEDFYPLPLDAFRYQGGELMCLPQNISSLVVYVNVDLFEQSGIQVPYDGWTWDEFVAAAEQLTVDLDGDGTLDQFGVVVESSMYRISPFIWSAGGELVDNTENPTALLIDSPEARDGIERFVSLGAGGHNVVPPEAEVAAEDDLARFTRGGAGMYLQSRRPVPTLREIEGFRWDVVPLPVINQPATVLHSDAFCMADVGGSFDAAWSFVEFAISEEGQLLLAETGRTVPSLIDVSASQQFLTGSGEEGVELPPSNSRVYLDNIEIVRMLPNIATWPEVEAAFNAEFDRAFYVDIDIDAAIESVIERSAAPLERGSR